MKNPIALLRKPFGCLSLSVLLAASVPDSRADLVGPYTPDANTLFLFHLDEAAGSAVTANVGSKGGNAITVTNDSSFDGLVGNLPQVTSLLGHGSFPGFGNALSGTNVDGSFGGAGYDGNVDGQYTSDQNGVPSPDEIALTNLNFGVGAGNSPWTLEALIRPTDITANQEIICTDGHNARGFQFRLSGGQLEFNQIGFGVNPKFPIPTTGLHGFVANTWYHVALTYDGATLRMYWTKLDPSVGAANQIGSQVWTSPTTVGAVLAPLVIATENRGGFGESFRGLVDEVRISSIARAANGMQFFSPAVTISQDPVSQNIDTGEPVTFEVLASSTTALGYQWRFNGAPIAGSLNANTYSIASVDLTNAGNYDVIITNQTGGSATSLVAVLTVGAGNFLAHRWSFTTDTTDSVGGATGTLQGTATVGGGALVLDGTAGTYMELPPFLLADLTAVTFDFWATFGVNTDNCRVFDFGNTNFVSAFVPPPQNYVFFSPRAGGSTHNLGITGGSSESQQTLAGPGILDSQTVHVTCVVDPPNQTMSIYTNGVLHVSNTNLNVSLASLNDELCWIGRSLFAADPYLNGSIDELRIYHGALAAASIQQSDAMGPEFILSTGPVDIVVNPTNTSVAVGQTVFFSAAATGQPPIQYQWYKNGSLVSGATNASYSFPTVLSDNGATIQVFATNVVGGITHSDASAVATLSVFTPPTLAWLGAAGIDWDTISLNWTNLAGGPVTTFSPLAAVVFDSRGSGAPFVNLTESVNPSTLTANATTDYTISGSGALVGQGAINKQNSGTLIIDVANNLAGGVLISGGTLQIGNGGSAGTPGAGAITNNATLAFNRGDTVTVPNAIFGAGALHQNGFGALALSGSNSYSGTTLINSGTVMLQSSNALGSASSGTVVAGGAQLYVTANVNTAEGLTLNGSGSDASGALRKGGAGFSAAVGPVTLASDATIGLDGGAILALSNVVSGAAILTLNGGGTIALNANNTYNGGTVLSAAIVNVNANRALGPAPVTISGTGRFVIGDGLNVTNAFTADTVSPGVATGLFMANDNTNGTVTTLSGPLTLNALATDGGHFAGPTTSGYLNVAGPVTMPGVGGGYLVLVRLGNVRFSGVGSGYDHLEVRAGTTSLGANNAIASTAVLDLAGNGSPTVPTYFDLNGFNQTLAGLKNTVGPANLGVVTNSSATTSTLTLDLVGGFQTFSGYLAGNLALVLNFGTQVITGTNAYTGNTTVNGGTLQIAEPTLAINSTVTVATGAILQLDFAVTNQVSALVLNGVNQAPGVYNSTTSPGFLTGSGSLRVQSIATNPTNVTAVVTGNQYQLSWPASHTGWRLEAQTNSLSVGLSGNWVTVSGSATTNQIFMPINPANGSVFFRLVYP